MKIFLIIVPLFFYNTIYAQVPNVTHNVLVQTNSTQSQCTNFHGQGGPEQSTIDSSIGQFTGYIAPSIRTCTGCYLENKNCRCQTCYDYSN